MKSKLAVCLVLSAFLVPAYSAYANDTPTTGSEIKADTKRAVKTTKTAIKDSVITTKIKTKLAAEHPGSLTKIKVDTDANGIVTLSGFVNSRDEAEKAKSIARNTKGVTQVKAHLKVQAGK